MKGFGRRTTQWFPRAAAIAIATVIVLIGSASPVFAKYASYVMDAETGRVLHAVNSNTRNYPASLTKMMTVYLLFEALEQGKITLKKPLKVSHRAARQPASRLALRAGTTIAVEEAIQALIVKSANDVATVVAEALAGSEREFALKMTARARKLGMTRTTFRNASGLYNRAQLSTARDMAVLARALIRDFPQYYHYFSKKSFAHGGNRYRSHNKLLTAYNGTDGIKTGYINASGFNLVASVERDGHRLIGVVFGGRSSSSRNRHMIKLLDKGFRLVNQNRGSAVATARAAPNPAPAPRVTAPAKAKVADARPTPRPNAAPPPAKPRASRPPAKSSGTADWAIQVGAYRYYNPAHKMARLAVDQVPDMLEGGVIKVIPLKKKNRRTLWRARIMGLTKEQAYSACDALQRKGRDCMEVRMKGIKVIRSDKA